MAESDDDIYFGTHWDYFAPGYRDKKFLRKMEHAMQGPFIYRDCAITQYIDNVRYWREHKQC